MTIEIGDRVQARLPDVVRAVDSRYVGTVIDTRIVGSLGFGLVCWDATGDGYMIQDSSGAPMGASWLPSTALQEVTR